VRCRDRPTPTSEMSCWAAKELGPPETLGYSTQIFRWIRENYERYNRVFGWRCGANLVGADPLLVCLDEGQRKRSGSRRGYSRKMRVRFARRISRDGANPDGFRRRPSRPSRRPRLDLVPRRPSSSRPRFAPPVVDLVPRRPSSSRPAAAELARGSSRPAREGREKGGGAGATGSGGGQE
jgi:hypothetical protein